MLVRLLVTRIVAKSLSGIPSNLSITWLFLDLTDRIELISAGDKEKKAASAPETNAEIISNTNIAIKAINRFRVKVFTVKSNTVVNAW